MDKFIKLLLETENTVILPDFGAIVVENETTGDLMFNAYLKFNDGKLDNIIVANSNMDLQEAQNYIAKHIREIQAEIDKGNEYSIFELGTFTKDKDGDIQFKGNSNQTKASEKKEKEPQVAGPSPTPPAKEAKEAKVEEKPEDTKATKKVEKEQTKEDSKKEQKPIEVAASTKVKSKSSKENKYKEKTHKKEKPKPQKGKKKKKKGALFFILIALLVIIAGGSTYIGLNYDEFKAMMGWDKFEEVKDPKELIAEVDTEDGDEVVAEENETENTSTTIEEDQDESLDTEKEEPMEEDEVTVEEIETPEETQPVEEIENTPNIPTEASGVSGNYYIIAGTFTEQSNAEKLVNELKQQGYPAEIVGFLNNMHYVSVQSFTSRGAANGELTKISGDVPKAWVYKKP